MAMSDAARSARYEYHKQWRKENREKWNSYQNEWRKNNPEKVKQYNADYWERKAQKTTE